MNKIKINFQKGQAMMVATIFFLIVSLTIILGLAGPTVRAQKMTRELFSSRQSYFVAEAGLEDVIYRVRRGLTVGAIETLTLNGSSATTVTTDVGQNKSITATGEVDDLVRKVAVDLVIGEGVTFHYGIQVGNGGFVLANNAGVNGNVFSNFSITGSNGSFITGDALAVGTVTGVDVGGDIQTGLEPQSYPIDEEQITEWKAEAEAGGIVGSQTFSDTTHLLGPKKIEGDLILNVGAKLTITGTLWVTGNVVLNNGADVALDPAYGEADGFLVVDGTTSLSNNSTFAGSGEEDSYVMVLSTNTGTEAITLRNNAGAAILYAPYGTVQIANNAGINQVTAKTVSLQENAIIDYEQGLIQATFTTGPSGGYEIDSWREVE